MSVRDVPGSVLGSRLKAGATSPFEKRASGDGWQPAEREEMAEEVVELVTSTSPDFMNSLSCIEEEGNESAGSGSGQGASAVSSPHAETVPVDEPLDEKLFRLQNRVISMLEMQKRSQEPQKARRKPTQTAGVGRNGSAMAGVKRQGQDPPAEREGQLKISKSSREVKENVERSPSVEADWRNTPGGAVQHRKNLAKHYKEQLELLEHEEKELQHQMNLRQQLRLVLHDEAQQCEQAERACLEPESELAAHNAHEREATEQLVEENRQLDLLRRQLEEQLRISEQRRLQLERENQMLQRPSRPVEPNGATAERRAPPGPGGPGGRAPVSQKAPGPAALRTKSPRPRAYSPPRPRVTSPQRAWLSATKQAKQCAPPPPSPATEGRTFEGRVAPRTVPKFQHPRPARVPVQRVSPPRPVSDGGHMGRAKMNSPAPSLGSTPEDGMPFPDGSLSARLPSPTREKASGAFSSPQPVVEGHDVPPLPLPLSYREVKPSEQRPVPMAVPANMVMACETPSWAAVQHTYTVQAGQEEATRTLECQKAGPPRRLGPGRGLVWPTLDLPPISPELIGQAIPASSWHGDSEGHYVSSGVQEKVVLGPDPSERLTQQRINRSLARSSSAANCSRVSPQDSERRASPSPARGPSPSSLIRSSSTPLVGQSRRPVHAVKPSARVDARGREDHFASRQ